ncbi:hypothetical protein L7F22_020680 [Adiantum nelumboides]|nr:hypothetical protein [Adiantum nelumboides]
MTVDCQQAMEIESQAPERIAVGGASLATIESLRARLLSERAASKEARQHVETIAFKVSELQSRLDAETEQRRKAEAAMKEVLEVLRAKGLAMDEVLAAVSSISGSSESEEAAPLSTSKDCDSETSSGEEASQAPIENHQCSFLEVLHAEAKRPQLEAGSSAEDSSSDKGQIMSMDSSRSDDSVVETVGVSKSEGSLRIDNFEVEKKGMTENEKVNNFEQVTETATANSHEQVSLTDATADASQDRVGVESNIRQPSEVIGDCTKHLERQVMAPAECELVADCGDGSSKSIVRATSLDEIVSERAATVSLLGGHQLFDPLLKEASSSHVGGVNKPKGLLPDESVQTPYGQGDEGAHAGERLHLVDGKMARGLPSRDLSPPVKERNHGLGLNYMHPGLFPKGGYLHELPYMNGDPFQHMHYVPSAEVPFSRGSISTAYGADYGRYLSAPISDAILSLVDDKSGKLGSILMALNLAKQQINDDEYTTCYTEVCEADSQSPSTGKPYPGLYEGVAHQPSYPPWIPDPQNQAPIIHLPMSPTSDFEASAFERHDGVRQSRSASAYFTPGYDPYLQPKGELHLGNGITLYTD